MYRVLYLIVNESKDLLVLGGLFVVGWVLFPLRNATDNKNRGNVNS